MFDATQPTHDDAADGIRVEEPMEENQVAAALRDLIEACEIPEEFCPEPMRDIRTFEEAGVLTRNAGLVLAFRDGSEFQVTVVRSR